VRFSIYCVMTLCLALLAACNGPYDIDASEAASLERQAKRHQRNVVFARDAWPSEVREYCRTARAIRLGNPHLHAGEWCDRFDPRAEFATAAILR